MPVIYPDKEKATLPDGRVRHWLADREKGTKMGSVHENIIPPGGTVPAHRHDVEELIVCLSGSGEWVMDGTPYEYYAGCVAHIPPGTIHSMRNTGDAPLRQLAFFPHPEPPMYWVKNEY
ncbi:MAG: cupin domain-containing protein [Candidatus Binataceae bacterium]